MGKSWIRVWRVAKFLDCSRDYVYDLVKAGQLEGIKIGSQGLRISQDSLEDFVEKNKLPAEFSKKN
jgi:excisionase family DNA binding protein